MDDSFGTFENDLISAEYEHSGSHTDDLDLDATTTFTTPNSYIENSTESSNYGSWSEPSVVFWTQETTIKIALYFVQTLLAVTFNLIVIALGANRCRISRKNFVDMILINMCFINLLQVIFIFPLEFVANYISDQWTWPFLAGACRFWLLAGYTLTAANSWNVVYIACFPTILRNSKPYIKTKWLMVVASLWVISLGGFLPYMHFIWTVEDFPGYCVWSGMADEYWLFETLCVFWIPATLVLFVSVAISIHYCISRKNNQKVTYPAPIMAYSCANGNTELSMFGLHRSATCNGHATQNSEEADKLQLDNIILAVGVSFSFLACIGPYALGTLHAYNRDLLYYVPHGVKVHKIMVTTLFKPLLDAVILLACWRPYREKIFGRHCRCWRKSRSYPATIITSKY